MNIFKQLMRNRVAKNAGWIIGGKIMQMVISFIVGLLTARYLGPSNYGLIGYAASLVTFVIPISQLGFNNTLVHEITNHPLNEGRILGTSIGFSMVSSVLCILGVVSFAMVANFNDWDTVWLVFLYSLSLLFQVMELIRYWFQAKLLSKYTAVSTLVAYVLVSGYKLFLLLTGKSVCWFAVSFAIDYAVIAVVLFVLYRKLGGQKMAFDFSLGKEMFLKSRHYIITGLMVAVFSQTDKIMLKSMIDEAAVGFYTAALTIVSTTSFVYVAIIDSFRPIIFSAQENEKQLEFNLMRLYSIIFYLSLAQGVVMTLFADLIVNILYGVEYATAVSILCVIVWYIPFSYFGSVRNIWILAKGKQKYLWIINASGAGLNVVLNWFLIPVWGGVGAAVASLATQFFSNFIIGFIIKPIRRNNALLLESLKPKYILSLIKKDK